MLQTSNSKFSLFTVFALATISLSLSGCGGDPPQPSGTVTGTVKSRGEICGNCRVSLHSLKGTKSFNVDESGTFELKDIPFDDYVVTLYQAPTNNPVKVFDKRIPQKYRETKTSGLSLSITSPEPVVFDIDMK